MVPVLRLIAGPLKKNLLRFHKRRSVGIGLAFFVLRGLSGQRFLGFG
jgi:hypothetical protein